MIFRLILSLAILLLSIYIGIWIQREPGYVLIMFQHWTIESSVWIILGLVVCLVIFIQIGLSVIKNVIRLPEYWKKWLHTHRLNRAQAKTKQGFIEFSEGQWQTAKKHLIAAAANTDQPFINYLTAAKAAEKLGDHPLRDHYLVQAQSVAPDATIAIELTQAQLQLDNHEWQEAAKTIDALHIMAPDHPYVLQLSLELYRSTQNWTALVAILPKLKPNKTLSTGEIYQLKKEAYLALLKESLTPNHSDLDINHTMRNLPKDLKHDTEIVWFYAQYLLDNNQDDQAEKYLRDNLKLKFSDELVALYADVNSKYAQISFVESLIKQHPDSAALHLCIGRLFFEQKVWGSARSHMEKSIHNQPSQQAYYALGLLLESLDLQTEACLAYRQGLECLV